MRKMFIIALFLLIPFAPLIASWWHRRNGGGCPLDDTSESKNK